MIFEFVLLKKDLKRSPLDIKMIV